MDAKPVFIDSNILIYVLAEGSQFHAGAKSALEQVVADGCLTCISCQVLREVLAVITREGTITPRPSAAKARDAVAALATGFDILDEGPPALQTLLDLTSKFDVKGSQVHDAHIVATMLNAGVARLLTNNAADFKRYSALIEIVPL